MTWLKKWALAIILFFFLVIDGVINFHLHQFFAFGGQHFTISLCLVSLLLAALIDELNQYLIWLALGLGVIFDISFNGLLGLASVTFPMGVFLCQWMARFLPEVMPIRVALVAILTSAASLYSYLLLSIFGLLHASSASLVINCLKVLISSAVLGCVLYGLIDNVTLRWPFMNRDN